MQTSSDACIVRHNLCGIDGSKLTIKITTRGFLMLRLEGVSPKAYERVRTMNLRAFISTRRVREDGEISFKPRKNTTSEDAMRRLEANTLREIEQAYKPVRKRKNKTQNYDGNCVKKSFKDQSRRAVYG